MKYIRLILIIALLFGTTGANAAFIEGMEDIPLPDGMHQITQDDFLSAMKKRACWKPT